MKNTVKRMLSCMVLIIVIVTMCASPVFAETNYSTEAVLKRIAEEFISFNCNDVDGIPQTTYKNIDTFINEVRCQRPEIPELEIAKFILCYTQQGIDNLPDEIILQALEAKEITTNTSYIKVDENGTQYTLTQQELQEAIQGEFVQEIASPLSTWTSDNGYMKIDTTCTFRRKEGINRYFTISAKAEWLKMPVCFFEDVLTIGHTGSFDDTYSEFGYKYQNNVCCGNVTKYNCSTNFPNSNISLEYPATTVAAIRFKLQAPLKCSNPQLAHLKYAQSISSYIIYGIIFDRAGTLNVQGAYCHQQIGVDGISIGISGGDVSFSFKGIKKDYKARTLTVQVT